MQNKAYRIKLIKDYLQILIRVFFVHDSGTWFRLNRFQQQVHQWWFHWVCNESKLTIGFLFYYGNVCKWTLCMLNITSSSQTVSKQRSIASTNILICLCKLVFSIKSNCFDFTCMRSSIASSFSPLSTQNTTYSVAYWRYISSNSFEWLIRLKLSMIR